MLTHLKYLLLDAARMGATMDTAKEMNAAHDSLYRGSSEETLAEVAPYLFFLPGKKEFVNWYMEQGWGDSWGIFAQCDYPIELVHKHFRKFLIVKTEDGGELYFRFYDPRVLRIFLSTCDKEQLTEFFGPIDYFVLEDEDAVYAIRYWLENGLLRSQRISREDIAGDYVSTLPDVESNSIKGQPKNVSSPAVTEIVDEPLNQPMNNPSPEKAKKTKWNLFD